MIGKPFRLAVYQFAPEPRRPAENARRIVAAAAGFGADLVLTPELSLTGYDLGDDAVSLAVRLDADALTAELAGGPDLIVGLVEEGAGGLPFNAAVHLHHGRVTFRHRKIYLPTYGMFDEARFFGRGDHVDGFEPAGGWRAGILICEDFWHPGLAYLLAARGIHLLLVQAAAPGRGAWDGGVDGGRFASNDAWTRIARTTAQLYGIYVALANRVGAEGGLVFGGGSLIIGPTGDILARAPSEGEAAITAELSLDEIAWARRPYAHSRDEDLRLHLRELSRLLEEQK